MQGKGKSRRSKKQDSPLLQPTEQETWALLKRLMKPGPSLSTKERGRYLLELIRKISKPPAAASGSTSTATRTLQKENSHVKAYHEGR
jgi:hypothetical protein